jgi:hypothetical protein
MKFTRGMLILIVTGLVWSSCIIPGYQPQPPIRFLDAVVLNGHSYELKDLKSDSVRKAITLKLARPDTAFEICALDPNSDDFRDKNPVRPGKIQEMYGTDRSIVNRQILDYQQALDTYRVTKANYSADKKTDLRDDKKSTLRDSIEKRTGIAVYHCKGYLDQTEVKSMFNFIDKYECDVLKIKIKEIISQFGKFPQIRLKKNDKDGWIEAYQAIADARSDVNDLNEAYRFAESNTAEAYQILIAKRLAYSTESEKVDKVKYIGTGYLEDSIWKSVFQDIRNSVCFGIYFDTETNYITARYVVDYKIGSVGAILDSARIRTQKDIHLQIRNIEASNTFSEKDTIISLLKQLKEILETNNFREACNKMVSIDSVFWHGPKPRKRITLSPENSNQKNYFLSFYSSIFTPQDPQLMKDLETLKSRYDARFKQYFNFLDIDIYLSVKGLNKINIPNKIYKSSIGGGFGTREDVLDIIARLEAGKTGEYIELFNAKELNYPVVINKLGYYTNDQLLR